MTSLTSHGARGSVLSSLRVTMGRPKEGSSGGSDPFGSNWPRRSSVRTWADFSCWSSLIGRPVPMQVSLDLGDADPDGVANDHCGWELASPDQPVKRVGMEPETPCRRWDSQ